MRRTLTSGLAVALAASLVLLSSCGQEQASTDSRPPAGQATPAPSEQAPTTAPATAEPFLVSRIDLGTAVDAANRVKDPKTVFKPADTVYASIVSDGTLPNVTLAAAWIFADGKFLYSSLNSSSKTIEPPGPAVTEFHFAPPDGWKAGKYELHVIINTGTAHMPVIGAEHVRAFEVQE